MTKYSIAVGFFEPRRFVEVEAENDQEALYKARDFLDDEAYENNKEPPVAWTLEITNREEVTENN